MRKKFEGHTRAHLGDSGIVLGAVDGHGCRWGWEGDDPWSPSPSVRAVGGDRSNGHGTWDATRFYGPRSLAYRGTVTAPSHSALHTAKQRLSSAVTVTLFQLLVEEPGWGPRTALVRRNAEVLWTERRNNCAATYSLSLLAPDPVAYSAESRAAVLPAAVGDHEVVVGEAAPVPPLPAAPQLTFAPSMSQGVRITNVTTGEVMVLSQPLTDPLVPPLHSLTVDCATRQVRDDAGVSRRGLMSGDWISLAAGVNDINVTPIGEVHPLPEPLVGDIAVTWREGWI